MSVGLESHRLRFTPHEWRRMIKMSALYTQLLRERPPQGLHVITLTTEEILGITLARVDEGRKGYTFKDSDILFVRFLCRCCLTTILSLGDQEPPDEPDVMAEEEVETELTERAALEFLQRRQSLDAFLAFIKGRKLKGKMRAFGAGFPKYGAESWDVERIAKDLRVTPATIAKYRSQLREFLEEFELQRTRPSTT